MRHVRRSTFRAGETRQVRFRSGPAGTYHYWATTTGMPLLFRAVNDTQLSGAFIVDPAGAEPVNDRVFVITDWTSLTLSQLREIAGAIDPGVAFNAIAPKFTFLMNGLSWPHTERLTASTERTRAVAGPQPLDPDPHDAPARLLLRRREHRRRRPGPAPRGRRASRRSSPSSCRAGATMAMTWTPERIGNWLFHCHIRAHVSPGESGSALCRWITRTGHAAPGAHDASAGMAGMILGVTVLGANGEGEAPAGSGPPPPRLRGPPDDARDADAIERLRVRTSIRIRADRRRATRLIRRQSACPRADAGAGLGASPSRSRW